MWAFRFQQHMEQVVKHSIPEMEDDKWIIYFINISSMISYFMKM